MPGEHRFRYHEQLFASFIYCSLADFTLLTFFFEKISAVLLMKLLASSTPPNRTYNSIQTSNSGWLITPHSAEFGEFDALIDVMEIVIAITKDDKITIKILI